MACVWPVTALKPSYDVNTVHAQMQYMLRESSESCTSVKSYTIVTYTTHTAGHTLKYSNHKGMHIVTEVFHIIWPHIESHILYFLVWVNS